MVPLDLLSPGEVGRVVEIDGDESLVVRLAEMGVRAGTEVRMLRPGSPCILAVDNRRVSFRGDKAAAILVEPLGNRRDASSLSVSLDGAEAVVGGLDGSVEEIAEVSPPRAPTSSSRATAAGKTPASRGGLLSRWLRAC